MTNLTALNGLYNHSEGKILHKSSLNTMKDLAEKGKTLQQSVVPGKRF
jgi:hypothetical protein